MAQAQIMHGARAKLYVNAQPIGFFSQASWHYDLSVEPAFILGRFSAAEIGYTAADIVRVECSGFRVITHGPHSEIGDGKKLIPTLDELLTHDDITMHIDDRLTGKTIMKLSSVRPQGYRTGATARQLSEMSITFVGLTVSDESAENTEGGNPSVDNSGPATLI